MTLNANKATTVKSTLAKLLAMENISIRHVMGSTTASFDVKGRVLRLPVWQGISEDLYDMLVVHEVGHALYTPHDLWTRELERLATKHNPKPGDKAALAKTMRSIHAFCNVVEDIRIDLKQRKRYPGSKRNYVLGYKELFDRDFFGQSKRPIASMEFIDRLNIYSKAGFSNVTVVPFTDEEKALVKRTQETETFEDVVALAEELWLIAKNRPEGEGEGEGEGDDSEEGESKNKTKGGKPDSDSEDSEKSEEDSESSDEAGDDSEEGESDSDAKGGEDSDEDSDSKDGAGDGDDSEGESKEGEGDGKSGDDEFTLPPEARNPLDAETAEELKKEAEKNKNKDEKKPQPKPDDHKGGVGGNEGGKEMEENPEDFLPESETDETFSNNVDGLAASNGTSYYYSTIPELKGEPWTDYKVYLDEHRKFIAAAPAEFKKNGWGIQEYKFEKHQLYLNQFKTEENKAISFMVKEFEMRKSATAYQKSLTSKTGVINTNKLHSYLYNDDIFKRNTVVPQGKSHGFVMFIDWSGSMTDNILNTTRQLISLCLFCKRIAVPFEVFTFTSGGYLSRAQIADGKYGFVRTNESLQMEANAQIRNILSSRMNVTEFNEALVYLIAMARSYHPRKYGSPDWDVGESYMPSCDGMGGTPLNETILIAEKIVKKFQRQSKVEITNVIFLTDGEGSPPALGSNEYAMNSKSYAIMIQDPVTRHEYLLPEVNGRGYSGSRYGNSGFDWTNAMLRVLKDRTKCNLVGFYLFGSYGGSWSDIVFQNRDHSQAEEAAAKASWKTNGYVSILNSGYDEYFLISSKAMSLDQVAFGEKETAKGKTLTAGRLATAFLKHMDKKTTNRVLLSNFIKKIT